MLPQPFTALPSHTLSTSTQAMPPSQLFTDEDCNIPSQERLILLEQLQELLGDVTPYFWAACHLCDLQMLKLMVSVADLNRSCIFAVAVLTRTVVANWNQAITGSASAATTPQSTTPPSPAPRILQRSSLSEYEDLISRPAKRQKSSQYRSRSARDAAEKRDNSCCVLTGDKIIEVAHIYPFCLLNEAEKEKFGVRHTFWEMLKNFWPAEKVSSWEAVLFPNGLDEYGLDTPRNLITLSRNAHAAWNKGAFALKPISLSEHKMTLTVQFFWQATHTIAPPSSISLTTKPESIRDLDCHPSCRLFQKFDVNDKRIKSGDFFELTTDDPEGRPLPDPKLLEMQWFLQRLVGMAGAADDYEDDDYHFSDDGFTNSLRNFDYDEEMIDRRLQDRDDSFLSYSLTDISTERTLK